MTSARQKSTPRPTTKSRLRPRTARPVRRTSVANVSRKELERSLAASATQRFVLRLYVTGTTPTSQNAIEEVRRICDEHLKGRYDLEVIDIYQMRALARDHQIVATPTLIKVLPEPLRRFVGDLSKVERVLFGLDLRGPEANASRSTKELRAAKARLAAKNEELVRRLEELEGSLAAIRSGEAEALVVPGPSGPRVFTVEGAERAYRVLVEAMNEGAATLSEDRTVLYCNARFADMLGAPLPQVMGASLARFLPDRSAGILSGLLAQASTGESRGEVELVGAAGEVIPAYLSVSVLLDEGRRRFCLVATDLRAQKRNEEIVRAERFARSVLEQAIEMIVVCDEAGRVVRASRSTMDLCPMSPLLMPFEEAFPLSVTGDRRASLAARAVAGEVLRAIPATLTCVGRPSAEVLASANALFGPTGRVIGCVITMVDVTEHQRAEQALRKTKEALEEADRRRNEFLAMLSHELRNPLAPIRYGLEILRRSPPGSNEARRAQDVMERQVAHLARLIEDLLDLTRITRGKTRLQLERLDVGAVVRSALEEHQGAFDKAGIALTLSIGPEVLCVNGDRTRLAQAIGNLLQNAAKFTPRGGTTVVSVEADEAREHALLRVADSGQGIAPQMLSRLFEPFSQADSSLDRERGGLGLGLAVVKSLVEMHGGAVTAESEGLGKGATFTIRLPLLQSRPVAEEPCSSAAPSASRRILIVEDNADAAEGLRQLLQLRGHQVKIASNGRDGIAAAQSWRPDVILCDIGLPEVDGYEVARTIRRDRRLDHVKLVALTGYGRPEDVERATSAGFAAHLVKPPTLEGIEATLAR